MKELLALTRPIGMQPVSALESTAQPQPFTGHAEKDLELLGTLGILVAGPVATATGLLLQSGTRDFWDGRPKLENDSIYIFFSCIAGQVRDMVGQQLE